MKKLFVSVATLSLMSACATLKPEGKLVKVADPAQLAQVAECSGVGPVSGDSEAGLANAVVDMRNRAGALGANVVVSRLRGEKGVGILNERTYVKGQAYKCPAQVATRLADAEQM